MFQYFQLFKNLSNWWFEISRFTWFKCGANSCDVSLIDPIRSRKINSIRSIFGFSFPVFHYIVGEYIVYILMFNAFEISYNFSDILRSFKLLISLSVQYIFFLFFSLNSFFFIYLLLLLEQFKVTIIQLFVWWCLKLEIFLFILQNNPMHWFA